MNARPLPFPRSLVRAILPLWVELKLAWYHWALREVHPLHADVPDIVRAINRLESKRRPT